MFRIGQKVVCVDDAFGSDWRSRWEDAGAKTFPVKDGIYTVRAMVSRSCGRLGLRFYEIVNPEAKCWHDGQRVVAEIVFNSHYFRPLVDRETDITVFEQLLPPVRVPELL